jgi:hypothetical protein
VYRDAAFVGFVEDWNVAATAALETAQSIARLTQSELEEARGPDAIQPNFLDLAIDNLIQKAEGVFEQLSNPLNEGDDEAFLAMYAFLVGNLAVADALTVAAEEPNQIAAEFRSSSDDQFSVEPWQSDVADAVVALRGIGPVGGAAFAQSPSLEQTLDTLTDRSGHELVRISTDTLFSVAIPQIPFALVSVMGGTAAHVFKTIQSGLHLGWAAVKRAASKVTSWVIDHIARVLPSQFRGVVETAANNVRVLLGANSGQIIGRTAGKALGLQTTRDTWEVAPPDRRAAAELELAEVTRKELSLISKVGRVREFLDRYGRWLNGVIATAPQFALALATLAVSAMVLVLSALWRGLRDVRELVIPLP